MRIFLINDLYGKARDAGYKARTDVVSIFSRTMQNAFVYDFYRYRPSLGGKRIFRVIKRKSMFALNYLSFSFKLKTNDTVVIQFSFDWYVPLADKVYKRLFKLQRKISLKLVFLIHDLNSLRIETDNNNRESEILKISDVVISHNDSMTKWLRSRGVSEEKIVNLELFDYLCDNESMKFDETQTQKSIIFAGNLSPQKSVFLYSWNSQLQVDLFGVNYDSSNISPHFIYYGAFEPNTPNIATGKMSFGLVWDGTSTTVCDGILGNYTRYNNPHKVSLYLSQSVPVIIWKEAALARFITKNKLGFVINSLDEIQEIVTNIDVAEYKVLAENTQAMAHRIRNGNFLYDALIKSCKLRVQQ